MTSKAFFGHAALATAASIICLSAAAGANAQVYNYYRGNAFTTHTGSYTGADRVTVMLDLLTPIGANSTASYGDGNLYDFTVDDGLGTDFNSQYTLYDVPLFISKFHCQY